jgi:hypothetical protein
LLQSLDVVGALDARLGLSGHGRPFVDVHGHIDASRQLARDRLEGLMQALGPEPLTALELAPQIHDGERLTEENAAWLLSETLCYLEHLEGRGEVTRQTDSDTVRWTAQP